MDFGVVVVPIAIDVAADVAIDDDGVVLKDDDYSS